MSHSPKEKDDTRVDSKGCAPAIAGIWGREGGVGKGLSKLKVSVKYFAIYNLWKITVHCTSPK